MRFIHTGDIHLGARPESKREWAKNRGDEIWATFENLIKRIKNICRTTSKIIFLLFLF